MTGVQTCALPISIDEANGKTSAAPVFALRVDKGGKEKDLTVTAKKVDGAYRVGVSPVLKTGFVDKLIGGLRETVATSLMIVTALKNVIANFEVQQLGGPIALYTVSSLVAREGFSANGLKDIHNDFPPVQSRNRNEVENPEVD